MNNLQTRQNKFSQTDLYPIITPAYCGGKDPLFVLESVLKSGATIVQLREKVEPQRYAAAFREITNQYDALLIINDFVDIALEYNADGVHIGQEDTSLLDVRNKAPELLIGVSINTLQEALFAQNNGADYINIGVAFPTQTKSDIKKVTGLELIKQIAPKISLPYTVIGGINRSNINKLLDIGARHIAMITALSEAKDIESETAYYINLIRSRR